MARIVHVLREIVYALGSLTSRTINAVVFGGSMHQTLSARAYVESYRDARWARRRRWIDAAFFLRSDHCRRYWQAEVDRARRTLSKAEAIETNWS